MLVIPKLNLLFLRNLTTNLETIHFVKLTKKKVFVLVKALIKGLIFSKNCPFFKFVFFSLKETINIFTYLLLQTLIFITKKVLYYFDSMYF